MKAKSFILALVAVLSLSLMAMVTITEKVPQAVKEAFAKKYPTAKKVDWEKEGAEEYEAEFKMDGKKMSANFKADGTWLETETEIKTKNLPAAVKAAIAKQFPDYELEEAEQIETPTVAVAYEVELEDEKNDVEIEAVFKADGTLVNSEVEKDDDHDHDDDDDDN